MSRNAPDEFQIGDEFESRKAGHMIFLDVIGRGGMGTVFEMGREDVSTRYALKTIHPSLLENPDVEKRFQREANMLGRLDNLRVVRIHAYLRLKRAGSTKGDAQGPTKWVDAQGTEGIPCIVMDRLRGATLAKMVSGKRIPLIDVCTIAGDLLSILDYIHGLGIVHRDIKPDNVFVRAEGVVTLIDFGIFKDLIESGKREALYIGTPRYSAHEQLTSGAISPLTDLYAVGVLLYELLTNGKHPYGSDTHRALMDLSVAPVHILKLEPDMPRPIADAIMSAVSRKPEDRPKDANEFARPFRRHAKNHERERNRANDSIESTSEGDLFAKLANSPETPPPAPGSSVPLGGPPRSPGPTGTMRISFDELRGAARAASALPPTVPPGDARARPTRPPIAPTLPSAREPSVAVERKAPVLRPPEAQSPLAAAPPEERVAATKEGEALVPRLAIVKAEPDLMRLIDRQPAAPAPDAEKGPSAPVEPRVEPPDEVPSLEATSSTKMTGRRRPIAVLPVVGAALVSVLALGSVWALKRGSGEGRAGAPAVSTPSAVLAPAASAASTNVAAPAPVAVSTNVAASASSSVTPSAASSADVPPLQAKEEAETKPVHHHTRPAASASARSDLTNWLERDDSPSPPSTAKKPSPAPKSKLPIEGF